MFRMQFSTRIMDGYLGMKSRRARYRVAIGQRRLKGSSRPYARCSQSVTTELATSRCRCLEMIREIELIETAADCRKLSVQVCMLAWHMGPGPDRSRVEGYCQRLELRAIDLENQATELADS